MLILLSSLQNFWILVHAKTYVGFPTSVLPLQMPIPTLLSPFQCIHHSVFPPISCYPLPISSRLRRARKSATSPPPTLTKKLSHFGFHPRILNFCSTSPTYVHRFAFRSRRWWLTAPPPWRRSRRPKGHQAAPPAKQTFSRQWQTRRNCLRPPLVPRPAPTRPLKPSRHRRTINAPWRLTKPST